MQELLDFSHSCLCPPGDGVYTVHTGQDKKNVYQNKLYQGNIKENWRNSLISHYKSEDLCLLGIPSDTGGGIQRGANWGPLFIREFFTAQNPNIHFEDLGDIRVIPHLLHDKYLNEETMKECREALYLDRDSSYPVSPLSIVENFAKLYFKNLKNKKLVSLGGDHSVSYPLVSQFIKEKKKQNKKVAIIHFDAHTDLMDKRLGIDLCFGTWARHIIPLLDNPKDLIQIGVRSSGKERTHWEKTLGITQYWAHEVREMGPEKLFLKIKEYLKDNYDELYISFDIDALDSSLASATGTPESDGLSLEASTTIIKLLGENYSIGASDLVEVAPFVSHDGSSNEKTLKSSSEILKCLIEAMNNDL